MPSRTLDAIDHILALDLGGRGIANFFTPGAALSAARALLGAHTVLIVTGFCVPPGLPETDGPPGAAVLGRALRRLGARVRYVTDSPVRGPLAAALMSLDEPVDVVVYPEGASARALLARERPSHLVSIERPGRTAKGEFLSARGESVRAWNHPLDELFLCREVRRRAPHRTGGARHATRLRPPVTIGIGDGGNEIGMGNVRARLARQGPLTAKIASRVRVDHLVVAGTSNWGAYGVVVGLSQLSGKSLLHTPDLERRLVEACVQAGAVDGVLRRPESTVDGLPLAVHMAVVELLQHAVREPRPRRASLRSRADRV